MSNTEENAFVKWRSQNSSRVLEPEVEIHIQQWVRVNDVRVKFGLMYYDQIQPWLAGTSDAQPDIVQYIALYGYTRTVTGNWKHMPISIPEEELDYWRSSSGLFVTIQELREDEAGVAGSVAEILHARKDDAGALINKQLTRLCDELDSLVKAPLDSFSPTQWDEYEVYEEEAGWEISKLDRIFDLYQELWCFEQGIEELRMLMITEDAPEFHLPSKEFYDALLSINSHKLIQEMRKAEPKLKQVLELWSNTIMEYSGKPYHRPYDSTEPHVFWWRHKKTSNSRR